MTTDKAIINDLKRKMVADPDGLLSDVLDLINRKDAEIDRLEDVLIGVMHFVDKWLDGAELEQDEVNRASAMREKTLQIVENQQAKIKEFDEKIVIQKGLIDRLQAENKRLINDKCGDCAGCTQWLCDCSNIRDAFAQELIYEIENRPPSKTPDGAFYFSGREDRQKEIVEIIKEKASEY